MGNIGDSINPEMGLGASLSISNGLNDNLNLKGIEYLVECFDKHGNRKWAETFTNLITNAGKNDIIDKYLKGSGYTAAWYLGLKGTGSAAAGDTLASHAGWAEVTAYTGDRKAITWGTTASQANTASAVSFSINGSATVAGAFVTTAETGTSGVLFSAGDFSGSRSVESGDTLNVTPTLSA